MVAERVFSENIRSTVVERTCSVGPHFEHPLSLSTIPYQHGGQVVGGLASYHRGHGE